MTYPEYFAKAGSVQGSARKSDCSKITQSKSRTSILKNLSRPGVVASVALSILLVALTLSPSLQVTSPTAGVVTAFSETIATVASSDCSTPKSEWDLGQTACAAVTGAIGVRRILWITPDSQVADVSSPFSGSGSDTYTFLTSGPFAQYGTWRVLSIDNAGNGFAIAAFLVRPDNTQNADLSIHIFGPNEANAGGAISYRIEIVNKGPNPAQSVVL